MTFVEFRDAIVAAGGMPQFLSSLDRGESVVVYPWWNHNGVPWSTYPYLSIAAGGILHLNTGKSHRSVEPEELTVLVPQVTAAILAAILRTS